MTRQADTAIVQRDDSGKASAQERVNRKFAIGSARACGGAIIFGLPMLMTMEMWQLGFYMSNLRLALLILAFFPVLVGLSYYAGFRKTFDLKEDVLDAFVAYAIGFVMSAIVLLLFGLITSGMSFDEVVGKVALQAVPASIGAVLAQSQLGEKSNEERQTRHQRETGYGGELFHMLIGALFLSFNLAPTEEMVLIAHKMTEWHALALLVVSLAAMHAFVYAVEFSGHAAISPDTPFISTFIRFTVAGYALALVVSLYVLWTFGRTDSTSTDSIIMASVVLGFPSAIGAASARLIL